MTAGVVLGVQSVPDGLATGLLAGVNPLAGLYGYMVGTATGALVTSSAFMAVQGTGAMAMIMADVPGLSGDDAARRLAMLSVLTGAAMLVAGFLRLGSLLRFVSNAVMVGFINAVGVNIVLGQLSNLTGYGAEGANRVIRAVRTLLRPDLMDAPTVAIGLSTMAIIVVLGRTRVGQTGLVIGIVVTSAAAALLGWSSVATLDDLGVALGALPSPILPEISSVPALIVPAIALAFVGLVQGAGISANFPNPDGSTPDPSRDFVGQGAANVASGVLRGMPVGGSVSATSLNKEAGARSRASLLIAALVMALVIIAFGEVVGAIAMPALAALLILIGIRTIKPTDLTSVWHTGPMQRVVMVSTFVLTMIAPLQYAVMVGVALSIVLHVVRQSNQVTIRRQVVDPDGYLTEVDPPEVLPPRRGRRPAALRQPVLRRCAGDRDHVAAGRRLLDRIGGHPPPSWPHRFRDHLHRCAPAVRPGTRRGRQLAQVGIGERADPRAAGDERTRRIARAGQRLPRRRPCRSRVRSGQR